MLQFTNGLAGRSKEVPLRRSESSKRKPFAAKLDIDPCHAVLVHLLVHRRAKGNRAHDAIAKLFINHRLVRIAVVLHNLVEAVDERLDGRHGACTAAVGKATNIFLERILIETERFCQDTYVLGRGRGLAIKDGGDSDLAATQELGEIGKSQLLPSLGGKKLL